MAINISTAITGTSLLCHIIERGSARLVQSCCKMLSPLAAVIYSIQLGTANSGPSLCGRTNRVANILAMSAVNKQDSKSSSTLQLCNSLLLFCPLALICLSILLNLHYPRFPDVIDTWPMDERIYESYLAWHDVTT